MRLRWRVQWCGAWLRQPEAYVSVRTGALERLAGDVARRIHMAPCGEKLVEHRVYRAMTPSRRARSTLPIRPSTGTGGASANMRTP